MAVCLSAPWLVVSNFNFIPHGLAKILLLG
jgi:hypothetical protein